MKNLNFFDDKTVQYVRGEQLKKLQNQFANYSNGIVRFHPQRCLMPMEYMAGAQKIFDVQTKQDDVFIITYPKCGTTWTQEIVWTLRNNPNLDHPKAHIGINTRCPFLEADYIADYVEWTKLLSEDSGLVKEFLQFCPNGDYKKPIYLQLAESIPTPRTMKSHMPLSFMHPDQLKSKIIYVIRNPKDACISYLHHNRLFIDVSYSGGLDDHVDYFIKGDLLYGPYDNHVKEALRMKDLPNFHLIYFEDLKNNTQAELKRLDAFLGTNLTEDQLKNIGKYTSFPEMKKRDAIVTSNSGGDGYYVKEVYEQSGGFFRKGAVGDHKQRLTPEHNLKLDEWMETQFKNEEMAAFFDKYSSEI